MVGPGVTFSRISVGVEDFTDRRHKERYHKKLLHKAYVEQKEYL